MAEFQPPPQLVEMTKHAEAVVKFRLKNFKLSLIIILILFNIIIIIIIVLQSIINASTCQFVCFFEKPFSLNCQKMWLAYRITKCFGGIFTISGKILHLHGCMYAGWNILSAVMSNNINKPVRTNFVSRIKWTYKPGYCNCSPTKYFNN